MGNWIDVFVEELEIWVWKVIWNGFFVFFFKVLDMIEDWISGKRFLEELGIGSNCRRFFLFELIVWIIWYM